MTKPEEIVSRHLSCIKADCGADLSHHTPTLVGKLAKRQQAGFGPERTTKKGHMLDIADVLVWDLELTTGNGARRVAQEAALAMLAEAVGGWPSENTA
jgi:hypothetical protein